MNRKMTSSPDFPGGGDMPELSLAEIYKDYFLIGSVFSPRDFSGGARRFELMKTQFNVLTAENAMKPDGMQREKDAFTFGEVDDMIDKIQSAGINVHGHTLVWHNQSPFWMNNGVTRTEAEVNLTRHITYVASHYSGKLISWDVVNEAISDEPENPEDWRASLRRRAWFNAFAQEGCGEDYIYMAFRTARLAAPGARLYYNDYNMDKPDKALAVYKMVEELNERYLEEGAVRPLIDGVGMQGHYSIDTDISAVERSILLFGRLGVEISISELDVSVPGASPEGLTSEQELSQAVKYAQLFSLFKRYSHVIKRVTLWGVDDGMSWRAPAYPLLFDRDLKPKQAFYAAADPERFLNENKHSVVFTPEADFFPETEIKAAPKQKTRFGTAAILAAAAGILGGAALYVLHKSRK